MTPMKLTGHKGLGLGPRAGDKQPGPGPAPPPLHSAFLLSDGPGLRGPIREDNPACQSCCSLRQMPVTGCPKWEGY